MLPLVQVMAPLLVLFFVLRAHHRLLEHHGINRATNEDLGQALIFQHTVTHAVSAAAGPSS
jgi:hypothetical protein